MEGSYRAIGLALGQPPAPLVDCLAIAERAEAAGFGILGVGDFLSDSFTFAGALAARTRQAELFTSIAGWTRSPVATAVAAVTAAELSDGRFRLGLGSMPQVWSEQWHDVDYTRPVERMREFVAAVRAAAGSSMGRPASFAGERYTFTDFARPSEGPGPPVPIYLGATRPGMTRLAGEAADGLIVNAVHSVSWLREVQLAALNEGLRSRDRARADVDVGILVMCAIDDDAARAAELARRAISFYFVAPYFRDLLEHHDFSRELEQGVSAAASGDQAAAMRAVSDELVDAVAVHGTPEDVRRKLERYKGLVDWIMLSPPIGHPSEVVLDQTERIVDAFSEPTD
jgi:5,10-methylenetetrahydromethanopterin reductase